MNIFEVSVPLGVAGGAIVGGVFCRPYGALATTGGIIAGGIIGAAAGLLYSFFILFLCAFFNVIWKVVTGRLKFDDSNASQEKGAAHPKRGQDEPRRRP